MREVKNIISLIKTCGLKWLGYRLVYEGQRRVGLFERRAPATGWDDQPLGIFLVNQGLDSPEKYSRHRSVSDAHFFFKPEGFKPSFHSCVQKGAEPSDSIQRAEAILTGYIRFFNHSYINVGFPPDWHRNPIDNTVARSQRHWSSLSDFGFGDIKLIWEPNRFSFVYDLVRAYQHNGDERYAKAFWELVEDWKEKNPPNQGVNWKCGQEISFRLMAWVFGLYGFFESSHTTDERVYSLAQMVAVSARRIKANIKYALSQQNNHGISEGVGLFTAGILFPEFRQAADWLDLGKSVLERSARELIYDDGSFSQHSVNYHRVMLHDYVWAIQLGRVNGIEFSKALLERLKKAGVWLSAMMDEKTGRVPNLGANDGALILPLTDCDYLDYRPVVQAAGAIEDGKVWLPQGPWNELACWLGTGSELTAESPELKADKIKPKWGKIFRDGGYVVFTNQTTKLIFRCPEKFIHRPSQCDLLHLDVWHQGTNVFRDGGSYSYNCEQPWQYYFNSVKAHNTIQFDNHDQMPKLSRFLYGDWPGLKVQYDFEANSPYVEAGFSDWKGCHHQRKVEMEDGLIRVTDLISGFKDHAVLRWRLAPEIDWTLSGGCCRGGVYSIHIDADNGPAGIKIAEGWESLYYHEKMPIPVLEVNVSPACRRMVTELCIGNS